MRNVQGKTVGRVLEGTLRSGGARGPQGPTDGSRFAGRGVEIRPRGFVGERSRRRVSKQIPAMQSPLGWRRGKVYAGGGFPESGDRSEDGLKRKGGHEGRDRVEKGFDGGGLGFEQGGPALCAGAGGCLLVAVWRLILLLCFLRATTGEGWGGLVAEKRLDGAAANRVGNQEGQKHCQKFASCGHICGIAPGCGYFKK